MHKSALMLVTSALLACLLVGCSAPRGSSRNAGLKPESQRTKAPDFTLKDAQGRAVRLSDFRGQVVLLDFWATWCGPCKIEIPWFIDLQRRHKDKGFTVLGVAMDDEGWDVVKPFVERMGVNYRVVMGNDPTAQLYGGISSLPTTFMIDREGRVAAVHVGVSGRREFDEGVEALLQGPVPANTSGVARPGAGSAN